MERRKFLSLPKFLRRRRSEARIRPVEDPMEIGPTVSSHPTAGSAPNLGVGPTVSSPSTPGDQNPNGMQTKFLRIIYLTVLFRLCIPDRDAAPDSLQPILGRGNRTVLPDGTDDPGATPRGESNVMSLVSSAAKMTIRGVKEASDAFPPLKSAAAALCFILDNCEVLFTSVTPLNEVLTFVPEHNGVSPKSRIIDPSDRGVRTIPERARPAG